MMIVAEVGANHLGSLSRALSHIEWAKHVGADAVKFQAYTADSLTLNHDGPGFIVMQKGPWQGRKLYDLYKEAETPFEWFPELFQRANAIGIKIFASAFDRASVDLIHSLGACAIKIASFEITDTNLISYAASTKLPLILSTGMASNAEILEAIDSAKGAESITLLHCISAYPAKTEEYNIARIGQLQMNFGVEVGLSDHTLGVAMPVAATVLGATIIEKHFTLSRSKGGPDASFSMEPEEFKEMVSAVRVTKEALRNNPQEEPYRNLRRSLYVVKDIQAGETFTNDNVRSIRPGHGLAPHYYNRVIRMKAAKKIARGTPLDIDLIL